MVHWVQDANEPPSWPEAYRRLKQEGRRSRVSHPSETHRRFGMPRREDLPAFAKNNPVLCFDNLSTISAYLADDLCRPISALGSPPVSQ